MKQITIALAGNPNCGKTTLFNALTGSSQRVGNWPGVTVERAEGSFSADGCDVRVVDLPGIYSLSAFSLDEKISRNYILEDRPDVVVNIIDASNLERNLYLTTQLIELRVPTVVALNMMDVARQRRIHIEVEHLARHLGCPVIPLVSSRGTGIEELKKAVVQAARTHAVSATRIEYAPEVEESLQRLSELAGPIAKAHRLENRWFCLKLLENDEQVETLAGPELKDACGQAARRVREMTGDDIDIVIADGRYGFIHGLAKDVVRQENRLRRTVSDAIDRVVLNRILGLPIFLLVMYLMFVVTIRVGSPFIDFFDILCGTIFVDGLRTLLENLRVPGLLTALLADGIGGGIQTVSTFIPPISLIFLCLSLLEDSGYMARAAFLMDRLLRTFGLPGKAFLPMLVGFGCNVPAIMATRTLENERDRILTVMINPFMSCGARLPVYALFAAAFFPRNGGTLIFSLYILGILLALATGLVLKRTVLRGDPGAFVMELPPYHVPTLRGVLNHTWHKLESFIIKAGRVILVVVAVLGVLGAVGTDGSIQRGNAQKSVLGAVSRFVTPVFRPMGITDDNWPACVGLFTGIFAKEAVVGTLDALYGQIVAGEGDGGTEPFSLAGGIGEAFRAIPEGFKDFGAALADPLGIMEAGKATADSHVAAEEMNVNDRTFGTMYRFFGSRLAAISYLLFILIYCPCCAATAAIYRETNLRWAVFSVGYLTGLAWVVATVFYQATTFAQHPAQSTAWLAVCGAITLAFYLGLRVKARMLDRAGA